MTSPTSSVTVVGASLAGLRGVEALRRDGFSGTITLIGDELHRPYDRPPLSKRYLAGEWSPDRLALTDDDMFAALDLDLHLGRRAVSLDVANRTVVLDNDTTVASDAVLIATGARARRLPIPERDGLHVLRSLDDADRLKDDLASCTGRVVVIGAGFIGAEVAATARSQGLDVTMVDVAEAPMIRGLGLQLGSVCAEIHREHGVDLRLGVGVDAVLGDERVTGVTLSTGEHLDADIVLAGIGAIPNTEWLDDSGLEIDNGVVCDAFCLAAPGIAAAGDVARWHNRRFDEVMRVEHWDNAVDQGMFAARQLLAGPATEASEPFAPIPWFWSDQFDRKIQLAGRARPDDEMVLVEGNIEERRFATIFGRDGKLTGVFGMNRPRHVMQYRKLLGAHATWEQALAHGQES